MRHLTALLLFSVITQVGTAQDLGSDNREKKRRPLAGLKGIAVVVEDLSTEAEQVGFSKEPFKTDIELRLRRNGIAVLSDSEWLADSGSAYLYLRVSTHKTRISLPSINSGPTEHHCVTIELEVHERVRLERQPTRPAFFATTWQVSGLGSPSPSNLVSSLRQRLGDYIDVFINDYLAANPRSRQ